MISAHLLVPLAFLLALAVAAAQDNACPQFFPGSTPPAFANARLAQGATLLCNDGFAVTASSITRSALWSAERLTRASVEAARRIPRENRFHPDARLLPEGRAELADYARSGFDRGHMAPSDDMPDAQSQQQTFSLANMVPQAPALNRGPWERIESAGGLVASVRVVPCLSHAAKADSPVVVEPWASGLPRALSCRVGEGKAPGSARAVCPVPSPRPTLLPLACAMAHPFCRRWRRRPKQNAGGA